MVLDEIVLRFVTDEDWDDARAERFVDNVTDYLRSAFETVAVNRTQEFEESVIVEVE